MSETREDQILELFKFPFQCGITRLYKYMSMAPEKIKYLEEIFRDREIFLPSPTKFNDPFECRPYLAWYKKGKKLRDYFNQMVLEEFPETNRETRRRRIKEGYERFRTNQDIFMRNLYEEFLNSTGLYCLTQIPDNILMWSHYAKGHSGIVLEFNVTKEYSIFYEAIKVHYSKDYPLLNLMEIDEPQHFRNALLTKSVDWEYEDEWRIVKTPREGGTGKYKFAIDLLTGVIFGATIERKNKDLILEWLQDYNLKINLYQANINDTKYKLDIQKL
jgi:hypothetical protein